MTSPNEIPKLPVDDLVGSMLLTPRSLANEFESYASKQDAILNKEWHTSNGTYCNINFLVLDIINDGVFAGNLFGIALTLSQEVYHLTEDFEEALKYNEDFDPPETENLLSLNLTHKSEYLISQNAEFGWTCFKTYMTKEYIGDDDIGPVYGTKDYHLQEDVKLIEINLDDTEKSTSIIDIVKCIADLTDETLGLELDDIMSTNQHLNLAYELYLILQGADENTFDLTGYLPDAFNK